MTIKPVFTNPNPILRKPSVEIDESEITSSSIKTLIKDLKETMAVERGVGIAAPQVGVHLRIILIDIGSSGPKAFINPRIVRTSLRKIDSEEGCLSVPGVFGIVRRYRGVVVEAYNEKAEPITIRAEEFPATVFQHEIDHLNGILFIDKVVRFTSKKTSPQSI